jgi:hypothetical protein
MTKRINEDDIAERMGELMQPINQQILMCNDKEDLLMLACAMLTSSKDIFDQELGKDGRKKMFKDFT